MLQLEARLCAGDAKLEATNDRCGLSSTSSLLLPPIVFIASAQAVPLSLSSEPSDEQSHAHARPNCRLASMEDKIDAVLAHLLSGKGF